jgi:DNA-binding transcriptional regulator GbsR (MarR family)
MANKMKTLKKKLLSKTLGKTAYWTVNKSLVKSIGLESTLILQHIIDLQDVFEKDEIFQSQPEMSKELGISEYSIKTRIPELIKLGLVNVVKKGVPCKNYYSTNDSKVIEILLNGLEDTKSTDLLDELKSTDEELNSTDSEYEINPQLVSNQLTGDTEIVSTITKNTTNNVNKEYTKQYTQKETDILKPIYNSEFDPSVFDDPIFLNSLKK